MKKLLLGTTALVGFAASSAALAGGSHYAAPAASGSAAAAGGLTVMIGGIVDSQAAFIDQDVEGAKTAAAGDEAGDMNFNTDVELHVTAAGSTDSFDYGAVVELNTNVDGDPEGDDAGGDADKTYIFVEGDDFGRFEFGSNEGASGTMEIDASNIARATGGIEGDWWHHVNTATVSNAAFEPNLVIADAIATGADAAKLTYYTPRFSGLQLGVSYTPDSGDIGSALNLSAKDVVGEFENIIAAGINYEADLDGVGLAVAAVIETGDSEESTAGTGTTVEDLEGYSIGAKLDFGGVAIAGNWADRGDTGQAVGAAVDNTYWTLGAAVENGPYGLSVTYMDSEFGNAEHNNIVVGADYAMAPGFTPYVEAAFFEFDDGVAGTTAADNEGSVVLLGAELSF